LSLTPFGERTAQFHRSAAQNSSTTTTQGKKVLQLIERFERYLDKYKRPDYKEARVRAEFTATSTRGGIDPFLESLGWDVRNVQGRGE
jgi:hypothetical protein